MTANTLTQERLKEILCYDPDTGIFTHRKNRGGIKAGSIAGNLTEQGYIRIKIDSKLYYAHRLAWLYIHGNFSIDEMDHINHVRNDNRLVNLRSCTKVDNLRNQTIYKNNSSGITGVNWHKRQQKWIARIRIDGQIINIGSFAHKEDAAKARKAAEIHNGFHENHGNKKGLPKQPSPPL